MKTRNWISEIYGHVEKARALHEDKDIIIQMSEPLKDLIICQSTTQVYEEVDEGTGLQDGRMFLFGCQVAVTNQITTYRIFVEE
jgi:hypothetical protein